MEWLGFWIGLGITLGGCCIGEGLARFGHWTKDKDE